MPTVEVPRVTSASPPRTVEPLPTPAPSGRDDQSTQNATPREVSPPEDDPATIRAAKRRRMDPPLSPLVATVTEPAGEASTTESVPEATLQDALSTAHQPDTHGEVEVQELSLVVESGPETSPQLRKRRQLPWTSVNQPRDGDEEGGEGTTAAPTKKARQPTRTRARKKTVLNADAEDAEQQDGDGEEETDAPRRRPGAKAKRKTATTDAEGDTEVQPASKRVPRSRKAKSTLAVQGGQAQGDPEEEAAEVVATTVRRKPRAPKRKKAASADVEGVEGETNAQPKRKGRPPREPTPDDAETRTIDPEETYMDSLASRNIRVGQLSNREKEMRKIDWGAVRERRRQEDSRPIQSKQEQEKADKNLLESVPQTEGPRIRVVDGQIVMVPDSGTINREADADREMQSYKLIDDNDITTRITSRSFMKNNKRFPNDFILPGQGKRWNTESTHLFYQGLKSFGTDFQMISHMFPGSTRRSIKTKFTREEREYPERVRNALQGQNEIVSHWDVFLEASQKNEESFVDTDEIKRQLAEEEAIMREKIEAAKLETEERNRQKAAAGVLDGENEGDEANNKENGKGKKKRKDKGKQVTFQEEQGVEIVGTIDDDDTWGQE